MPLSNFNIDRGTGVCDRRVRTALPLLPAVCSFREASGHLALEDVWRLRLHLCCEQRVDIRPNPIRLCAGKWVQDSLWPERRRGNKKIILEIPMQIWDNLFTYYNLRVPKYWIQCTISPVQTKEKKNKQVWSTGYFCELFLQVSVAWGVQERSLLKTLLPNPAVYLALWTYHYILASCFSLVKH